MEMGGGVTLPPCMRAQGHQELRGQEGLPPGKLRGSTALPHLVSALQTLALWLHPILCLPCLVCSTLLCQPWEADVEIFSVHKEQHRWTITKLQNPSVRNGNELFTLREGLGQAVQQAQPRVCVCTCVRASVQVHMHMWVCACGVWRTETSTRCLTQSLFPLHRVSHYSSPMAGIKPREFCVCFPAGGIINRCTPLCPAFYSHSGTLSSCPHACTASTLPTEPSSQSVTPRLGIEGWGAVPWKKVIGERAA